jgi:hypothetical protein
VDRQDVVVAGELVDNVDVRSVRAARCQPQNALVKVTGEAERIVAECSIT